MFSWAIIIHNTGLCLIERNHTREGLKLLNDALEVAKASVALSNIDEQTIMNIQSRYAEALAMLSTRPKEVTDTSTDNTFYVVDYQDLNYKNLSSDIMTSETLVVIRLEEENFSLDNLDMICAVMLQNLASVYSVIDLKKNSIHSRGSIELLLLSRTLQLKIFDSKNEVETHVSSYDKIATCCQLDVLQLMMTTLWHLVQLSSFHDMNSLYEQVNNELMLVRRRFLHVMSRTEMFFSDSHTSAPCA